MDNCVNGDVLMHALFQMVFGTVDTSNVDTCNLSDSVINTTPHISDPDGIEKETKTKREDTKYRTEMR